MNQRVSLDYYQRLGIPEFSSKEIIKVAFRKLALEWHPDRHPIESKKQASKQAEDKFKKISEAYDVLMKYKEQYDFALNRVRHPGIRVVYEYSFGYGFGSGWTSSSFTGGFR